VWTFRERFLQANAWTLSIQNTTGGNLTCDVGFDVINTRGPRF
jgi:hypothetical protein